MEAWVAESKWWSDKPVGVEVVEHLLAQAEIVRERKSDNIETLRLWLFAHDGFTRNAEALMRKQGVLCGLTGTI